VANQNTDSQTSNSQGASEVKGEKLYAGKYKSVEELEKAYSESEKRFHEGRQERTELNDRLDRIEQRISQPREPSEGYGRGQTSQEFADTAAPEDTALLSAFYNSPRKVLATLEDRAAAKAEQRIAQRQQTTSKAADRVASWSQDNGDVTPYGDLLTHYVGQTPQDWSIERRLDEGAKRVRQRIIEIRGSGATDEKIRADEFIDGAGSNAGANRQQQSRRPAADAPADREAELVKHISAHNASAHKPLGGK